MVWEEELSSFSNYVTPKQEWIQHLQLIYLYDKR
jgi:hypothetical protein